ncbi:MAG: hypothetical protein AAFO84_17720, partial [Cyanobacteria bacterium J06598_1]
DYCKNGRVEPKLRLLYAEQLWVRGRLQDATAVLSQLTVPANLEGAYYALQGAIAFLVGQTKGAIAHYQAGLKAAGKSQRAQTKWFEQPATIVYFFALLAEGSPASLKEAEKSVLIVQRQTKHPIAPSTPLLFAVLQQQQSKPTGAAQRFWHSHGSCSETHSSISST